MKSLAHSYSKISILLLPDPVALVWVGIDSGSTLWTRHRGSLFTIALDSASGFLDHPLINPWFSVRSTACFS